MVAYFLLLKILKSGSTITVVFLFCHLPYRARYPAGYQGARRLTRGSQGARRLTRGYQGARRLTRDSRIPSPFFR